MSNPDDIATRRARQLRQLAELGMAQARALEKRMLTARTSEMGALAAEFERVAREVRETIILEAALERGRRRALRLTRERVRPPRRLIPDPDNGTVH